MLVRNVIVIHSGLNSLKKTRWLRIPTSSLLSRWSCNTLDTAILKSNSNYGSYASAIPK